MKRNSNSIGPEFRKGLTEEEINSPEFNPDDFAPAPDGGVAGASTEGLESKRNSLAFALITALLALIIGFVGWGVSASINAYYDNITENEVLSVFPNCTRIEQLEIDNKDFEVYAVFFKERIAGYCVLGSTEGFGGPIRFAVAFNSNNEISQVKILEHNESMGLGSKIAGNEFLSKFEGILIGNTDFEKGNSKFGSDADLIAGATISATAVKESIKEVIALGITTDSIAIQFGYETITEEEIEEEVRKEEEEKENNNSEDKDTEKAPSKDTSSGKDPADTTNKRPGIGDHVGGSNVNTGDEETDKNLSGDDEDTVYDSETAETEEPEETTGIPEDTKEPDETTGRPEDTNSPETTKKPETSKDPETSEKPVTTRPEPETTEPEPETTEPEPETTEPEPETTEPEPETTEPEPETTEPEPETTEPDSGTSVPESDTAEPDSETNAPEVDAPVDPSESTAPSDVVNDDGSPVEPTGEEAQIVNEEGGEQ